MKSSNQGPIYSEAQTDLLIEKIGHSIPLDELLKREGGEEKCLVSKSVIDGDQYMDDKYLTSSSSDLDQLNGSIDKETSKDKPKSTDIVFALENNTVLLSECKLKIKTKLSSFNRQQLIAKVTAMTETLSRDLEPEIISAQPVPILFANETIERAKSRIRKWYPGKTNTPRPFVAMTIADFLRRFFELDL